ncbi:hypothetical protein [Telluribacter humicola]|uniref:hypothetical protein n=1 Tax=Telluribacter humicola TaxID=1720261 RepID=UPI001A96184C|nr:hypothetical protein [Telluribacter humicola]
MNGYSIQKRWFKFSLEHPEEPILGNHGHLLWFISEEFNGKGWPDRLRHDVTTGMNTLHIGSWNTYKKCLEDLEGWGFISILQRGRNQYVGWIITLAENEQNYTPKFASSKNDKALDKADCASSKIEEAPDKAPDEATILPALSKNDKASDQATFSASSNIDKAPDEANPVALSKIDEAPDEAKDPSIDILNKTIKTLEEENILNENSTSSSESEVPDFVKKNREGAVPYTPTPVRDLDYYHQEMQKSVKLKDAAFMWANREGYELTDVLYFQIMADFIQEKKGLDYVPQPNDIKPHFMNWLRIRISYLQKNKHRNGNSNHTAPRRGSTLRPTSIAHSDYGGTGSRCTVDLQREGTS